MSLRFYLLALAAVLVGVPLLAYALLEWWVGP